MILPRRLAPILLLLSSLHSLVASPPDLMVLPLEVSGLRPMTSPEAVPLLRDGNLELVFSGMQNEEIGIYWSRREGDSWGKVFDISAVRGEIEHNPAALIDKQGRLQVVWQARVGRGVYLVRYRGQHEDGTWGPVHSFSQGRRRMLPGIVEGSEGHLYIYYDNSSRSNSGGRIFVHVSEDGGASWRDSDPNFSAESKYGRTEIGEMVATPDGLVLAWIDQSPGPLAVVVNSSSDGGRTWRDAPTALSTERRSYRDVRLLYYKGVLVATWALGGRDETGPFQELFGSVSKDQGKIWSPPAKLYRARGWSLSYHLVKSASEIGFVSLEKRANHPDRLVFRPFWDNNMQTELDVAELWAAEGGRDISGLTSISSDDMMGVMFSEVGGGKDGTIHALVRNRPDKSSWSHIELNSELKKLNRESGDVNAMGPVGFIYAEGEGETLNFVFHLAKRRRFIEETVPADTQLVFGRVFLN